MGKAIFLLAFSIAACFGIVADAAVVERTFIVEDMAKSLMCKTLNFAAVNGQMPGPTLEVTNGDTVIIHVINRSSHKMTIHWHGIKQLGTPWADGPEMITQCPITHCNTFTQKFTVKGQEGTLWWHAHIGYQRATVYGAIIIRPRGFKYPFTDQPVVEVPILIGEWWETGDEEANTRARETGSIPTISDAFTINGLPGDQVSCSKGTFTLNVEPGTLYLLRIINAALSTQHFFKIAGHEFAVVGTDATYTNKYKTDTIVIASGQTVDALFYANAWPDKYYMAAKPYSPSIGVVPFNNHTATGIVSYSNAKRWVTPVMPVMPDFNDTLAAFKFFSSITSLYPFGGPKLITDQMFITLGLGRERCQPDQHQCDPKKAAITASMNNISFVTPSTPTMSIMEAYYYNFPGIFTTDFPDVPPEKFDYTNFSVNFDPSLSHLLHPVKGTKVKKLRWGSGVEIVLQNTALVGPDYHPMHIHGYNFYVVAQGFGNYDPNTAEFNLKNPQERNTVAVPTGGYAVIRFVADNPGIWLVHCHMEQHVPLGLNMVFLVENGGGWSTPPPPSDLPNCLATTAPPCRPGRQPIIKTLSDTDQKI